MFSKSLNLSFNITSLFKQPVDTSLSALLKSINGQYAALGTFKDRSWRTHLPANPGLRVLDIMEPRIGHWKERSRACTGGGHCHKNKNNEAFSIGMTGETI